MSVRVPAALAALAIVLVGCAPETASDFSPTPDGSSSASTAAVDLCADAQVPSTVDDSVDERLSNLSLVTLIDTGSRTGATGKTTLNADGDPASYVVATDDTVTAIAERFCTSESWLQMLNSVRRNSGFSKTSFALYAGDTLNLDPHTITTVGDENSVAYTHKPNIHLPSQD